MSRPPYHSDSTVKIVIVDEADSSLQVHDTKLGGVPRCGVMPKPWHGHEMELRYMGAGMVTCGNCRRMTIRS